MAPPPAIFFVCLPLLPELRPGKFRDRIIGKEKLNPVSHSQLLVPPAFSRLYNIFYAAFCKEGRRRLFHIFFQEFIQPLSGLIFLDDDFSHISSVSFILVMICLIFLYMEIAKIISRTLLS